MRADGELQLEEKLVDRAQIAVLRVPQLAANLAELRRPEGEGGGDAFVAARVVEVGAIEADAGEPALAELVIERCVEAFAIARRIRTIVHDPFETRDERVVQAAHQRSPSIRDIEAAELIRAANLGCRSARVTRSQLDVAVLADVFEQLQMSVVRQIVALLPCKDSLRLSAKHFNRSFCVCARVRK